MVKSSCDPNEYPRFGFLSEEKIAEKSSLLSTWIWENSKIPKGKLLQSDDCIRRIIDLVERRRVYFHVFHGIDMSEWNEASLYCFWIAKLHPYLSEGKQLPETNSIIAVRLLYNTVNKFRKRNGKSSVGHPCITNLIHAFTYRDISKESVMAIFETLIEIP
jgi:hypothetical protein